jgi:hypothetical protein
MAIAFRAQTNNSGGQNPSTTISLNKPAGTVSGDLLLAVLGYDNDATVTWTLPSGWTQLDVSTQNGTHIVRSIIAYKVAGGSEPSSYTFTPSDNNPANWVDACLACYSGVDTTTPFDVTNSKANGSSSMSLPSITTVTNGCMLILAGNNWNGNSTTLQAGYTNRSTQTDGAVIADKSQPSAGATGTQTYNAGSTDQVAFLLALRPAGAGGASVSAAATIALKAADNTKAAAASIALKQTDIGKSAAANIALLSAGNTKSAAASVALKAIDQGKSAAASIALLQMGLTKAAGASIALLAAGLTKSAAATIALAGAGVTSVSAAATIALRATNLSKSAAASIALLQSGLSKSAGASIALLQAGLAKSAAASVALKQASITKSAQATMALKATILLSAAATICLSTTGVIVNNPPPVATVSPNTPAGSVASSIPTASVSANAPIASKE